MEIIYCSEDNSDAWDTFLQETENASFYHLFGWKKINEKSFGHKTFYLAALRDKYITGVFPLVSISSRLFGKILCSMPFVNFGGICALDREASEHLLREATSIVEVNGMDYLEMRELEKINNELPTSEHKVSLAIDLDPDPDRLWGAFRTKHRTEVRRAYKNGFTIRDGGRELLDDFYEILSEKWRGLGTPLYPKDYFGNIISRFPDYVRIFVVYLKGIPVAAAFNGYYKRTVEGMWAGSREEYKRLMPNHVLYWEMIKDACLRGYRTFHLGRSTVESGGESFKLKWNAYPRQLYWQYILGKKKEIPALNVDNPRFKLAIQAWKRLPIRLTNFIGPFISKNIP